MICVLLRSVLRLFGVSSSPVSPPAAAGDDGPRRLLNPFPAAGAGHPNPVTGCPICGEALVCRNAALEWIE